MLHAMGRGSVALAAGAFAALLCAAASCGSAGSLSGANDAGADVSVSAGAAAYANTCALCHGAAGEGYVADGATALANPVFLATASDDFLVRSVARGRPGTTMSAWDTAHAGPYDDTAIDSIVAFLRTWQTSPSIDVDAVAVPPGDPVRAALVFAARCASCHGATGREGPAVRLANPELLAAASDGFLAYAIEHGRPGTPMAGFAGALAQQDVGDLVTLLRSWQAPITEPDAGDIPIPGTAGPVLHNAGGPEPAFVVGQRYTPADTVKAELDRGAAFVLLDARAPSDYAAGHVADAIDLPFYDVGAYLDTLPDDRWIVCYCACPHAESGRAADTLLANGFTKVTIIDEGFFVWQSRGYPVHTGPLP
jgi:cytochrome c oxidase cbb3-type subunit 3/ubiquinol-cytochrome c reductase cytochrome c subunit